MKCQKYILSVIPIMFFNIIYFLWQPYNKHILPLFPSESLIADTFTNIIFYILWFGLIVYLSETCFETDYAIPLHTRLTRKLIALAVIQLVCDYIKYILYVNISEFLYFIFSFLLDVVVFTFSLSVIILKKQKTKNNHLMIICSSILIFLVFLCFIYTCFMINKEFLYVKEKYVENSLIYLNIYENSNFLYQIISLSFELLIFGIIYSIFYFLFHKFEVCNAVSSRNIIILCLRIFLVFFGLILVNIKVLIIPQSFLGGLEMATTSVYNDVSYHNTLDFEDDDILLYRYSNSSRKYVFKGTVVTLKYNNYELNCFTQLYNYDKNSKALIYKCTSQSLNDINIDFQIYGDILIGYIDDNNKPHIYFTDEIINMKKNDTLIRLCEKMIGDGDWNYFEWSAEYLLKYDRNFIYPYIEKYSNGEFSGVEKQLPSNAEIKVEYIQQVAKNLLVKTGWGRQGDGSLVSSN